MPGKNRLREAFEQIAMPYMPAVYQFAYSLARETSQAEDLVQDTFLNAFRSFHRFEIGTNCKAWLFRICKNLFIDRFRERQRRPVHQEIEVAEPPSYDVSTDLRAFEKAGIDDEELFLDLFGDEVNQFIRELPDDFRRAMLLCDLEGLAYEEIAQVLDIPIGTVRSRISRARAFLRERLEGYASELGYLRGSRQDNDGRSSG